MGYKIRTYGNNRSIQKDPTRRTNYRKNLERNRKYTEVLQALCTSSTEASVFSDAKTPRGRRATTSKPKAEAAPSPHGFEDPEKEYTGYPPISVACGAGTCPEQDIGHQIRLLRRRRREAKPDLPSTNHRTSTDAKIHQIIASRS